ncbi:hypothetical protein [Idiomarina sp. ST10R2A5]|uniref:hypothetical protein n=1 Tax=Idiomarina sp. ST10R2A5 TaxID=3418368 RepID=UPI003EC60088
MFNKTNLPCIGSIDRYFEAYSQSHTCQFPCRILNSHSYDCAGKLGGGNIKDNIVALPTKTSSIELHVKAEVFNIFENFQINLFFTDREIDHFDNFEAQLERYINKGLVVVARSSTHSFIDGEITLYNPDLEAFKDNFSELFGSQA